MAWENLEAEIVNEFGLITPDWSSYEVTVRERGKHPKDASLGRWERKQLAAKRARYGVGDRNRTYTVRASLHAKPASMRRQDV